MPKLAIEGGSPVREEFLVFGRPVLGEEEIREVVDTLQSRWIGTGPKALQFERDFAAYVGCQRAFAFSSCTTALHVSLLVSGVKTGHEVLVPAMTFAASANVIIHAGARPRFVDIDAGTLNLDLVDLERKISSRSRAIIGVHFGGLPLDLMSLRKIADSHALTIVEDAAHAVGAAIDERRIGNWGNLTAFSFYANKNITTGEGGMIATTELTEDLADRIAALRLHGLTRDAWKRFHSKEVIHSQVVEAGFKYNMTDIQASLGLHQLKRLEEFLVRREAIAERFRRGLNGIAGVRFQVVPTSYGRLRHGLHLFVLVLDLEVFRVSRDQIVAALRAENIGAAVHYTTLTTEPFYRYLEPDAYLTTPVANRVSESILSLPLRPDFTRQDENDVIEAVHKVLVHYRR